MADQQQQPDLADSFRQLALRSHPLRASLSREMHVRKMPRLHTPARMLQFVVQKDDGDPRDSLSSLRALLEPHGQTVDADDRFIACRIGSLGFAWERHTEFQTFSFIADGRGDPFELAPFASVPGFIDGVPGHVIRSSQIALIEAPPSDDAIAGWFSTDDLIISDVAQGRARIWSDFRLHANGFGSLLIEDRGLAGAEGAQLIQRLQELGNYRKMALMGLPEAQRATPLLTQLEQRLTAITTDVAEKDADAEQVLARLSTLGAELAQIIARTRYRMSATRAYSEICIDRLRRLDVMPVRGFGSLDDFTERRLLPAMRTCDAFTQRLDDLSRRIVSTSAMLQTRVDTALARRNGDLLASMDRRTALQLRLQHTVEGLSVVAISYYALGLWHHLKEAVERLGMHPARWLDLVLIPLTIGAVWLGIRQLKKVKRPPGRRLSSDPSGGADHGI